MTRPIGAVPAFLLIALANLWLPAAARADAALSEAIRTECALLERASGETRATGAQPLPDILVGCPGHERLRASLSRRDSKRVFATAARTPVPEAAAARGPSGKTLFQRMIARGVPVPVAIAMVETEAFAAAVAAADRL